MRNKISRRQFLSTGAARALSTTPIAAQQAGVGASTPNPGPGAWVRWLDGGAPAVAQGVTWGTPWPRGRQRARQYALRDCGRHDSCRCRAGHWPGGRTARSSGRRTPSLPVPRRAAVPSKWSRSDPHPGRERRHGEGNATAASKSTRAVSCAASRAPAATSSPRSSATAREALRDGKLVLLRQDRRGERR